jgi:hypothetical protein
LDGEGLVGVAYRIDLAVDRGERDAEEGRVDLAELWDVVGRVPASAASNRTLVTVNDESAERLVKLCADGGRGC